MTVILYSFAPQDRSGKIRWLLEELEVPYEVRTLSGENKEHKADSFKEISPMGLVPVLKHDNCTIFESGAIAIYLAETFNSRICLAPAINSPLRGDFLKWIFFATVSLDPLFIKVFKTKGMTETERLKHFSEIYAEFEPVATALESILKNSDYVIGSEFGVVDIMLAQPLNWAQKNGFLEQHPAIDQYLVRIKSRSACLKAGVFS